ncbi:MAG: acetylornithine deacetylase [Rhodobacteraceae bacterium]|nr:MAG: acetylornithine deacetylase [Paracoccaceae bacterium]|tara:strand:- start:1463 stop:2638 length:1176 start_codon:yes stop_codon:yes gene_type:complete
MINPNRNFLLQNLKKMISIPSINPFGIHEPGKPAEGEIAAYFENCLLKLGLKTNSHIVSNGRKNVWGVLKGKGMGPTILLAGHLDTVGVEGYKDPFIPRIKGDRIYGRGACDMKGGLAAILETVRILIKAKISINGDIIIAGIVDEEDAMVGSKYFGQYGPKIDFAIVAEPTDLTICPRHKGQICFGMKTYGRAAHSSMPHNGINAIYHMCMVIKKLRELAENLTQREIDPISGYPSLSVGVIRGGSHHSAVPDFCEIEIDRRTVFGETKDSVMSEFEGIFEELKNKIPDFNYEIAEPTLFVPPLKTPQQSPLIVAIVNATRELFPEAKEIKTFPGSTDAPNFNCPAVIFGAGNLKQCHSLSEYISIEDLRQAVKIYTRTLILLQDSYPNP